MFSKKNKFKLFIVLIMALVFSINLFPNVVMAKQDIISVKVINSAKKINPEYKNLKELKIIKEKDKWNDYLQKLDKFANEKIKERFSVQIDQITKWGLKPNMSFRQLEKKSQKILDKYYNGLNVNSISFKNFVLEHMSSDESYININAKKNKEIGTLYLYMCIYFDKYNSLSEEEQKNSSTKVNFTSDDYNKNIYELLQEDCINNIAESEIVGFTEKYSRAVGLTAASPWPKLNGNLIQEYAEKWALGKNPYYKWYDSSNDCTNFVSQALFYGTLPMTHYNSDKIANGVVASPDRWFYFNNGSSSKYSISTSFIRVVELFNYLSPHYANVSTAYKSTIQSNLGKGYVIQGARIVGRYSHSAIVTLKNGKYCYCAHSNNRKNEPISTFLDGYFWYRVIKTY